jgi:hypothetical protein
MKITKELQKDGENSGICVDAAGIAEVATRAGERSNVEL